jgi:hypothetical protein
MRHLDDSDIDFNTAIAMFYSKLLSVFNEMRYNINNDQHFNAPWYAGNVIKILQDTRDQVNQFFRDDTPANNDYNKKLQQIEAEGVSETPGSDLTVADSLSETKLEFPVEALALYLNKICLWAEQAFASKAVTPGEPEDLTPTKSEQVMLIHYTGLYSHLHKQYNYNHSTAAKIIAAIIGGEPGSVNRIRNFISNPANTSRNNPFRKPEIIQSLRRKLTDLKIDSTEFEKDLLQSQKPSK